MHVMSADVNHRWWNSRFKFANDAVASAPVVGQPYVNRKEMSATATISTATIDRVGDLLVPSGCDLTEYEKNPVVLYGHGLEGLVLPVGTSRNPNTGEVAVEVSDDDVKATCWFSQKSLEAAQIFELVDEGIIRATSVRETPLKSKREFKGREPYTLVESYSLEEWSWCSLGVNPDAVAKAVNGRVAGKRLHESICKSLTAQLPKLRKNGIGFTPNTKVKDMDEEEDVGTGDMGDDAKSVDTGSLHSNDDKTEMETPAEDVPGAPEDDTNNDDPTQQPYGQQYLAACHSKLKDCLDDMQKHYGPNEHPAIRDGVQKCMDSLKDQLTNIQGLHAETYPNAKVKLTDLPSDVEGGKAAGFDADQDDAGLKSFLASGQSGYRQQGIVSQLKSLATKGNLTSGQRKLLIDIADAQTRLLNEARSASKTKSYKPVASKDLEAALAKLSN